MRVRRATQAAASAPAGALARNSDPIRPDQSPLSVSPGDVAPSAAISPNASPSGADGLLNEPVDGSPRVEGGGGDDPRGEGDGDDPRGDGGESEHLSRIIAAVASKVAKQKKQQEICWRANDVT